MLDVQIVEKGRNPLKLSVNARRITNFQY